MESADKAEPEGNEKATLDIQKKSISGGEQELAQQSLG